MKLAVCIKQVPALKDMTLDPETRRMRRDGVKLEPNPFDMVALGAALELRDRVGGEVWAVSMGPPSASDVLKRARMGGADRSLLLTDRALAGSDTLATARALADGLRGHGFDLVLCGRESVDAETGQVGPMLAECLGLPVATGVTRIEPLPGGRSVRLRREAEGGQETLVVPLPAVVTAGEDLAEEVYVSSRKVAEAPDPDHDRIGVGDLGGPGERYGEAGSPTSVGPVREEETVREGRRIEADDPVRAAKEAERLLEGRRRSPGGEDREAFAGEIWVFCPPSPEGLHPVAGEILGQAFRMTSRGGGRTWAFHIGPVGPDLPAAARAAGADGLLAAASPELGRHRSDAALDILARQVEARRPDAVLFPSTPVGREVASLVAARLGLGLTGDIVGLHPDPKGGLIQDKPAFGGALVAPIRSRTRPDMATVRPGIFAPLETPREGAAEVVEVEASFTGRGIEVEGFEPHPVPNALLGRHAVVLGVGMGVGKDGLEKVVDVCERHGFGLAGTRNVTDEGWLPKAFQVGLTGHAVAPEVYVALGVSGAFEHVVGLRRAGTVIAVNTDPEAPIFERADLGIVGPWDAVLQAITPVLDRVGKEGAGAGSAG